MSGEMKSFCGIGRYSVGLYNWTLAIQKKGGLGHTYSYIPWCASLRERDRGKRPLSFSSFHNCINLPSLGSLSFPFALGWRTKTQSSCCCCRCCRRQEKNKRERREREETNKTNAFLETSSSLSLLVQLGRESHTCFVHLVPERVLDEDVPRFRLRLGRNNRKGPQTPPFPHHYQENPISTRTTTTTRTRMTMTTMRVLSNTIDQSHHHHCPRDGNEKMNRKT